MGWTEAEFVGQSADIIFTPEDRQRGQPERESGKALSRVGQPTSAGMSRKTARGSGVTGSCAGSGTTPGAPGASSRSSGTGRPSFAPTRPARRPTGARTNSSRCSPTSCETPSRPSPTRPTSRFDQDADAETIAWSKEVIARQVQNLSHMIDDILDISRINRGKIQLRKEPVHVGPIITRAVESVSHLVQGNNHELNVSVATGPVRVYADPTRLEQIVANLLINAAKYTDPGGSIAVSAYAEDSTIVIRVKDNGIGLSPEVLSEVFELFSQVDKSLDRTRGGLGIGLSVVKKLAEMHGGSVWASSEGLGKGSEFAVRLPALDESTHPQGEETRRAEETGTPPRRILVVDDNVDAAVGLARLLRFAGHQLEIAHDGNAAIALADRFRPDVLLLDIGLPGLSGYEVASQLRTHESCRECLFIAVSGYGQEQDRERSRAAGFHHHLAKPVDIDLLIDLIASPRPKSGR